ncbi:hypothetical protein [Methyloglobulus morosus]|nr:hypothetical protein [Methyloglobulus morosus]
MPRQTMLIQRNCNQSLREKIKELRKHDHAFPLLVEADAKTLDLTMEGIRLLPILPPLNVNPMRGKKPTEDA